ncbi:UNKNOWN [Stylonychia lemnae]|uniref:NADP-dependent oxidoreductase domain-containing protein n=1 Tax=Stylonychia lemnae TaxID=5949 RepID=A0A078APX3_STYLE|nr:UNKNOWN [Stylonychia lemnae]|eukprot:CDW84375.1 UNKNOWN [Stylonychia lemnae]
MQSASALGQDQPYKTLSSGYKMPLIGLGTDKIFDSDILANAVIQVGYRTLDTASRYQNEHVVGEAIQKIISNTELKRDDLFVVTKVWQDEVEDVEAACKRSLDRLKLDYVDLYLLHWPLYTRLVEPANPETNTPAKYERINIPVHKVWPQLEALVEKGLVRSIGVSNFGVQSLWDLQSYAKIIPAVNEIEINPLYAQTDLVKYCLANNILPIAYTPIARAATTEKKRGTDNVLETDIVQACSKKYQKSPVQVVLNWGISRGYGIIPKSANIDRQRENFQIYDFKMEQSDLDEITALNRGQKICYRDEFVFFHNIFA